MNTVLFNDGTRYTEKNYKKEVEIEDLLVKNSKILFGDNSIYIDAKKKIDNSAFGGVIPDGFLLDLSDIKNPEFYIVEAELSKHSFFNHIFPQVTKFFAFFKNQESQGKLIEKLYKIFNEDLDLKKELKSKIGSQEVFKFFKDTIENSQNILIVIDNEKKEFPEIIQTYVDTWGKMVKIAILKQYITSTNIEETILSMTPDFENIENIDIITTQDQTNSKSLTNYTVDYHLDNIPLSIKDLFKEIQEKLTTEIPNVKFNSQRYYISLRKKRNFAFIKIRKKKIAIIAMMKEEDINNRIKYYNVATLSQGVQNFYNGPCARIDITNNKNITEVIKLLGEIQK